MLKSAYGRDTRAGRSQRGEPLFAVYPIALDKPRSVNAFTLGTGLRDATWCGPPRPLKRGGLRHSYHSPATAGYVPEGIGLREEANG